jgi:cation-transporting ATPase 13A1
LTFAGFLVFTCPLKEDSREALKELNESSHRCIMITGDNPLTACHVAREVYIVERDVLILDVKEGGRGESDLSFRSIDDKIQIDVDPSAPLDQSLLDKYDICLTGPAMSQYMDKPSMTQLLEHTWVYARVSPSQKVCQLFAIVSLVIRSKPWLKEAKNFVGIFADRIEGPRIHYFDGR